MGTFSKTLLPSLRLSYVVVPYKLTESFHRAATRLNSVPIIMIQMAVAEFMRKGQFYKHLRKMRTAYDARRKIVVTSLSSWYSQGPKKYGLVIGFTNMKNRKKQAIEARLRLNAL